MTNLNGLTSDQINRIRELLLIANLEQLAHIKLICSKEEEKRLSSDYGLYNF